MAISSEAVEKGRVWKRKNEYPFPLLADEDASVIRAYDVFHANESKGRAIARPSAFVLDAEGEVVWSYVGERASDRPKLEEILEHVP